ncbi:MAG: hypothetical protein R8G66_21690 [Cytophagales bacterium]|nr:hypothetical protein [Cytophagales bacterium]
MKSFYFAILLILSNLTYGQFASTISGIYETEDIGEWTRWLILYPDSTYQFQINTDLGEIYYEPSNTETFNWSLIGVEKIVLHGDTNDRASIKKLQIADSITLIGDNDHLWSKIAEFHSNGRLWQFVDNHDRILTLDSLGTPEIRKSFKKGVLVKKETLGPLPDNTVDEIENIRLTGIHFDPPIRFHNIILALRTQEVETTDVKTKKGWKLKKKR